MRDNSYIRRDTADGQRDIATHSDISKELQELSCMNFDGNIYADIGNHSEFDVQNFELNFTFYTVDTPSSVFEYFFGINNIMDSGTRSGISISNDTSKRIKFFIGDGAGTKLVDVTATNPTSQFNYYEVSMICFNGNYTFIINKNGAFEEEFTGTYGTIGWNGNTRIGGRADLTGAEITHKEYYTFNYYELNTSGDRINHLIRLEGTETAGNTWLNTAPDAPAGSDAVINLNGSSDGDQFTTSIYASDHNQRYGRRQVGGFDEALSFFAPSNTDVNTQYPELEILFYHDGSTIGPYHIYSQGYDQDATQRNGWLFYRGGTDLRVVQAYDATTQGNIITIGSPVLGFNSLRLWKTDTNWIWNLNEVGGQGAETNPIYFGATIKEPSVGRSFNVYPTKRATEVYAGMIYYVKLWEGTNGGATRNSHLLEWDFANLKNGIVPNTAANAPENSDAVLNLNGSYSGRERVFIPSSSLRPKRTSFNAYFYPIGTAPAPYAPFLPYIMIEGDVRDLFSAGDSLTVSGTTSNNGAFTISGTAPAYDFGSDGLTSFNPSSGSLALEGPVACTIVNNTEPNTVGTPILDVYGQPIDNAEEVAIYNRAI